MIEKECPNCKQVGTNPAECLYCGILFDRFVPPPLVTRQPLRESFEDPSEKHEPLDNEIVLASLPGALFLGLCFAPFAVLLRTHFHEMGHVVAMWLTGTFAVPSLFFAIGLWDHWAFSVLFTALLGFGIYKSYKEHYVFCGFLVFVMFLQFFMLAMDPFKTFFFIKWMGVGGEFILSTLLVLAFYYSMPKFFLWNFVRYIALFLGVCILMKQTFVWLNIHAGKYDLPMGSLLQGRNDGNGDMNALLSGSWSKKDISGSFVRCAWICWSVIIIHYLGHATNALIKIQKRAQK